jgi:hypothetical protein
LRLRNRFGPELITHTGLVSHINWIQMLGPRDLVSFRLWTFFMPRPTLYINQFRYGISYFLYGSKYWMEQYVNYQKVYLSLRIKKKKIEYLKNYSTQILYQRQILQVRNQIYNVFSMKPKSLWKKLQKMLSTSKI